MRENSVVKYIHAEKAYNAVEPKKNNLRFVRTSRLDNMTNQSSIKQSEYWGFLNLLHLCVGIYLVSDPLIRLYESNKLFDVELANLMFSKVYMLFLVWLKCFLWSYMAYFTYNLYNLNKINWTTFRICQIFSQLLILLYPLIIAIQMKWSIMPGGYTMICATILFFKMHSFTEIMADYNDLRAYIVSNYPGVVDEKESKRILQKRALNSKFNSFYSSNLNTYIKKYTSNFEKLPKEEKEEILLNIFRKDLNTNPTLYYFSYYLICPVLVYEASYPQVNKLRKLYIARKITELLTEMVGMYLVLTRYLTPVMKQAQYKSIPHLYVSLIWPMLACYILIFFIMFECVCNILAELTYFGDREFYQDWWNSTSFVEFSRKWNKLVHEFLWRHVYLPCVKKYKFNKINSTLITIVVSGFFHELILATCFQSVRLWIFSMMMVQLPLLKFAYLYEGKDWGNYFFWFGMIFGTPLLCLAYGRK